MSDTGRQPLPNRRLQYGIDAEWQGHCWRFGLGPDADGVFREVFIDAPPQDPAIATWLHHDARLISELLQRGCRAAELIALFDGGNSPIALALHCAAALEKDHGAEIRATYAAVAAASQREETGAPETA